MKLNLWIYSKQERNIIANSLIVFGAEVLKRSQVIKEIDVLRKINVDLNNKRFSHQNSIIKEFMFEYLIDCIRISIFFENYMKAELIIRGFCVHRIKREIEEFRALAEDQYKRPIELKEINDIEPFEINTEQQTIFHKAIKKTTIGIKDLIGSEEYLKNYQFEDKIIEYIKELNINRNNLHFHDSIEFQISDSFIEKIERLNEFVDKTIKERKQQ